MKLSLAKNRCLPVPIVILLISLAASQGMAENLTVLPAFTPVFDQPDAMRQPVTMLANDVKLNLKDRVFFYIPGNGLLHRLEFYRLPGRDDQPLWVSPGLICVENPDTGLYEKRLVVRNPMWRKLFLGALIAGLFVLSWRICRPLAAGSKKFHGWKFTLYGIGFVTLIRSLLLLVIVMRGGNILLFSSDEPSFFEVAHDLSRMSFAGPWRMTVGFPLLLLPFVVAFGAKDIYDIIAPYSWFGGFFMMPLALALFYLIIRKLTGSELKAFISTLLWAVVPMFFFQWENPEQGLAKSYFSLPDTAMSFAMYKSYIWAGFNAMSDAASVLAVMTTVCTALYYGADCKTSSGTRRSLVFVVSAIFAFACLVRINNILFAPLVGWLFYYRLGKCSLRDWGWLRLGTLSLVTFLLFFSPQLIVNRLHFGSFFDFPYVLHNKATEGFQWGALANNISIVVGANLAFFAIGLTGLFWLENRQSRIFLTLFTMPLMFFFLGYVWSHEHTTRFFLPVYGALFAALVCADVWHQITLKEIVISVAFLAAAVFLICPSDYALAIIPLPWGMQNYQWGVSVAAILQWLIPSAGILFILLATRGNSRLPWFIATFMLLYFIYLPWVIPTLMLLAMVRVGYDISQSFLQD